MIATGASQLPVWEALLEGDLPSPRWYGGPHTLPEVTPCGGRSLGYNSTSTSSLGQGSPTLGGRRFIILLRQVLLRLVGALTQGSRSSFGCPRTWFPAEAYAPHDVQNMKPRRSAKWCEGHGWLLPMCGLAPSGMMRIPCLASTPLGQGSFVHPLSRVVEACPQPLQTTLPAAITSW